MYNEINQEELLMARNQEQLLRTIFRDTLNTNKIRCNI